MDFDGFDFGFEMETPGEVIEDEAPEVDEINPPLRSWATYGNLGGHRVM
jgi:hypothetical protein